MAFAQEPPYLVAASVFVQALVVSEFAEIAVVHLDLETIVVALEIVELVYYHRD